MANFVVTLLSLVFISPQPVLATIVIGRRTANEVVVGADSIEVESTGAVSSVCKIGQAAKLFFATFGHSSFSPKARHSWKEFIIQNVTPSATFEKNVNSLQSRAFEPVRMMNEWFREAHPKYHREEILNKFLTGVLLFAWENNRSRLYALEFKVVGTTTSSTVQANLIRNDDTQATFAVGWKHDIRHLLHDRQFWARDAADAVKEMIELQIKSAPPTKIAKPIDILRVDKSGARWVQRKPECPDVRP